MGNMYRGNNMNDNLVELIGIIGGVNYDGVINDLEIEKLQSWLAHNRQFRNDKAFNKALDLLENILEDNVITNEEKQELLSFANKYYQDFNNEHDSIVILHGLIEGIICDNVINQDEIEELKRWLEKSSFLKGNDVYDKVRLLVAKVLEDNILTNDERNELFSLFESIMFKSKMELKVKYLMKKIKNRQNIGNDLIELLNDDKFVTTIHSNAQRELNEALRSYLGSTLTNNEIIFTSLALCALLDYDGNFYEHIHEKYHELYEDYAGQKVDGMIRSIISKYNTIDTQSPRIINYVLMNAIVPMYFLPKFFEFMFDVYKVNFNYYLDENIQEDFKFIYEGLKGSLNHDTDELSLSATKKTYKLIKSTKSVILSGSGVDEIINLSINVLKIIDKHYWEERTPIVTNQYYKFGYDQWVKENEKKEQLKKSKGQNRDLIANRWKPTFKLEGDKVILVPPAHKVRNTIDYSKIVIKVLNDGKEIYVNNKPRVYEIIGGYQVSLDEIVINNPLGKLQYVIYEDDKVLYNSKELLYCDFIMFNVKGIEIENNKNFEGDLVICHNESNHDGMVPKHDGEFYRLAYSKVTKDTTFYISNTVIRFCEAMEPGIVGKKRKSTYLQYDNFKYDVYEGINFFVIESLLNEDAISLKINGKVKTLSNYRFEKSKNGQFNKYIIELKLSESGYYDLMALDSNNKEIKKSHFIFVVDSELEFSKRMIDDFNYEINVKSGLLEIDGTYYLNIEKYDSFNLKTRVNGKYYTYKLPLQIPVYKIDNGKWAPISNYIWIGDIKAQSNIYFDGFNGTELVIYDKDDNELGATYLNDKKIYLTTQISSLLSYKASNDYVDVAIYDGEKEVQSIKCYNRCLINDDKTFFEYNPATKALNVTPNHVGKGKVYLSIKNESNEEIFKDIIESNKILSIADVPSFEELTILFLEKSAGFSLKSFTELRVYKKTFYAYDDLLNRKLKINQVDYDQMVRGKYIRKPHWLRYTFLVPYEKVDETHYIGYVCRTQKYGPDIVMPIRPIEIEITSEPYNDTIEVALTNEGDGLLLDFQKHTISDDMDDPDGVDIYSYYLELKGGN